MTDQVRLKSPPLMVQWDGQLHISNEDGELLDPVAAEVLMALGGEEPEWLGPVEALRAVDQGFPGDWEAVKLAADAIGRPASSRNQVARSTSDAPVRLAMAVLGEAQVARNPSLTTRDWDVLVAHRRSDVANRAKRLAEVLPPSLAGHSDPDVRARVARNPACPPELLAELAYDWASPVRRATAANPSTTQATLKRILRDKQNQVEVWAAAAGNSHVTWFGLEKCLHDGPDPAREAAATNPRLPNWRVATLVFSRWSAIRRALAGRPDSQSGRLKWLERFSRRDQPNWQMLIRARITSHPNVSRATKDRVEQLTTYMRDASADIPRLRKLAPPSPVETLVLLAVLTGLAVDLVIRRNAAVIIGAALLLVIFSFRCRTVRPGSKVAKSWSQRAAPTDRRLVPSTRGNVPGRLLIPACAVTLSLLASHTTDNSPGSTSVPGIGGELTLPTLGNGNPDLAGSPEFMAVASDAQTDATPSNIATFDVDALSLQSTILLEGTSSGDPAFRQSVAQLNAALASSMASSSVAAWNQNELALRAAIQEVRNTQ